MLAGREPLGSFVPGTSLCMWATSFLLGILAPKALKTSVLIQFLGTDDLFHRRFHSLTLNSFRDGGMTRQVLFVQGGGEGVHDNWDNKLVASLERELGPGYSILYPRMPNEGDPSYAAWKAALVEEIAGLDDGAIIVGHSIGGTVLVNVLAEVPTATTLSAVLLVAPPFVGEGGWPSDDVAPMGNAGARLPSATPIYLFQGSDDDTTPAVHLDLYARAIPQAHIRRLEGRDHQLNNDMAEVAAEIRSLSPAG